MSAVNRREFIGGALSAATWAALPRSLPAAETGRPLKFLFISDHHIESDFVQSHGITKGQPVYTMWKPGDHAAIVETYRFINADPFCRDCDFALFGGDQINTGYSNKPADMAAEKANYFRTLEALDLHARTKGRVDDLAFVAAPWTVRENLAKGQKPFDVQPAPLPSRVIAIQGNHDTGVGEFYRDCAFTAGDTRFIAFFASYVGLPPPPGQLFHSTAKVSDATVAFIEREMAKAAADPRVRHIALVSHWAIADRSVDFQCPIVGACRENGMSASRDRLLALCAKYGCDLYLNGHEHNGRYPVGQVGNLRDINCGTLTANPGSGGFAVVELHPDRAVFTIYSRAVVEEREGKAVLTARPRRLFVREVPLRPIR